MPIIIFEKDANCHHGCNTYAISKLYVIQDIDVYIEIAINSNAYKSKSFLDLSILSLSLESLNVGLKGMLKRFVGKYEHFKQNIAILVGTQISLIPLSSYNNLICP
jgi:hypothetical protein